MRWDTMLVYHHQLSRIEWKYSLKSKANCNTKIRKTANRSIKRKLYIIKKREGISIRIIKIRTNCWNSNLEGNVDPVIRKLR